MNRLNKENWWPNGWPLFLIQFFAHLSLVPMVFYARPAHYFFAFGVYFFTGCLGMSLTTHRFLAHKSWAAPRWFQVLGVFLGSIGLTGSSLAWAAIHRQHHNSTDRKGDPHSPHDQTFMEVQFLSMFQRPNLWLVKDLVQDPVLRFFHKNYFQVNMVYALILIAIDPFLLVYGYLFPAALLWNAGSFINTIGHIWGYRNFHTRDHSRNNPLLGVLMWGEGWHNNHHRNPKCPKFSFSRFEIDLGYLCIFLILKISFVFSPHLRKQEVPP